MFQNTDLVDIGPSGVIHSSPITSEEFLTNHQVSKSLHSGDDLLKTCFVACSLFPIAFMRSLPRMPVRTTKKRSHRAHAAVQLEVGNSNSSEDEAPLKPIKQQGRIIPLDTFDDDDSDIPAVNEYTGTLNKRLKELDIQACGGRYSSKDQVPKDSKFFDKISRATGIEDKPVLVFGLPRQLNLQNGDWLCPGRQCGHRVSKIENLYAHIAASKSGHEYLKPVIRQSFCRPCLQFCKNPAGVLAHEMSHAL